jgi:carbon monoxide dehydrogenase subunit G
MAEIHKTATIDAPPEEVFAILDDPANFPKYIPNVRQVVDVQRTDQRVGDSFRVIYKVLGLTFDERFKTTDYQRHSRITSTFEGGMSGTFRWTLEPLGEKTIVKIDIDYRVAAGALGKAADALMLERINEKSMDGMLENLSRLAARAGTPSS